MCVRDNPKVRRIVERYAGVPGSGVVLLGADDKPRGRLVEAQVGLRDVKEERKEGTPSAWLGTKVEPPSVAREGEGTGHEKRKLDSDPEDVPHDMDMSPKKKRRTSHSPPPSPSTPTRPTAPPATLSSSPKLPLKLKAAACTAPPRPRAGQPSVLAQVEAAGGRSNVWLEEGFYERWCRCEECLPLFADFPYLLEEEISYDPPEDPEARKSRRQGS